MRYIVPVPLTHEMSLFHTSADGRTIYQLKHFVKARDWLLNRQQRAP